MDKSLKSIVIMMTTVFMLSINGLAQRAISKETKLLDKQTAQKKQKTLKQEKNTKAELSNLQDNKLLQSIETKKVGPSLLAQPLTTTQATTNSTIKKEKKGVPSPCHFIEILEHIDINFPVEVSSRGKDHPTCTAKIEMRRSIGRNFLALTSPTGTIIIGNLKKLILDFHKIPSSLELEIIIKKLAKKEGKKQVILQDTDIVNTKHKLEIWVTNKR